MTPSALYADVALPVPVDHTFTYDVPESLRARVQPGMRVLVPFQRRQITGYVVGLTSKTDLAAVRSIIDLPDDYPLFTADMLKLCRWMADYYCCSWGEALQCAVPSGIAVRSKMRYRLVAEQLTAGRFTDRQRRVIAELYQRGPLTEGQLATVAGRQALSATLQSLLRRGVLLAEPMVPDPGVGLRTETWVRLREDAVLAPEACEALQRRAPRQAAVYLDLLHDLPERRAAELYERHGVNAAILKTLAEKGLIEREERELLRRPDIEADERSRIKHRLNEEQARAFTTITDALDARTFQTFLLRGITGSGKTEVYLQAIEHTLQTGRDAILLVPEISLTPQTVARLKGRFHEQIAVLHSGLGKGERYDEWRRAQRGEVRIVVGARSAIFAPLPNVGLVVVDEEHDTSYKQGESPRYHGRDVAIMRALLNNAVCVLGSATPSLESYHNASIGKSVRLDLMRRATHATLAEVTVIDMREETREVSGQVTLSRHLEAELTETLRRGDQSILLLNRRGYAPFVLCPQCGWVAECRDCQVSLTYHASGHYLNCHYCNQRREVPEICDACNFNPLLFLGAGTQKIEDYLARTFPDARIARMDADTTAGKGGHAKILGSFAAGEIDILVGTQMLAKGHDYPGVTLVGVVNADTGLSVPDFRAAEQTFQLLTQVAGRAGRGDKPGRVVVQTFRPNHYAVQCAAKHDFDAFFQREIAEREAAGYPPFRRMASFLLEAGDPHEAERGAALLARIAADQIGVHGFKGVERLGPAPAAVRRVMRKYRWHLALLSKSPARLNTLARAIRQAFAEQANAGRLQLKVDLDPYGMY